MRWVAHAAIRPHRCAVIPFVGNSNASGGFIDTGMTLPGWDPHVYISVEAVKEMARMIGWQPAQVQKTHDARLAGKDDRIAALEAEIAENRRVVDAARLLAGVHEEVAA
jgi:hypothetical protein